MTKDNAIAELVRIWHSPHLDLSLKAGLAEAIDALKGEDGDLISRQAALDAIMGEPTDAHYPSWYAKKLESLPSAEPKTETVLCALADRTCPFQGKEYAWCLTCPHISEEDRKLVKKAVAQPKTGEWMKVIDEETPNVTKWHYECDQCGAGRFENGQQYCSRCGARMLGEDGEA